MDILRWFKPGQQSPSVAEVDNAGEKQYALLTANANVGSDAFASLPSVVFSLDTAAYAAGDVLADTQVLENVFRFNNDVNILESIVLNDKDDQGVALYIVILSADVPLGTENDVVSISDADADNILGIIPVASGDWIDIGDQRIATIRGIGLNVKSALDTKNLYVGLINGAGTPTFSASGITARFGFI